ncbi:MAG TPA: NUDIX domain-containing protein [Nocardioides sp.]|nr:NUDIX domain-containing protein [Nocardioides sp.]
MVTIDPVSGVSRFAIVPAAYVFFVRSAGSGEEVLLQLRQNTGFMDGHWAAAAAGHVERGETAEAAARREASEELGVSDLDLRFVTAMQRTARAHDIDERVDFFFLSRRWSGEPRIVEPTKCADLRWWPLAALPDPLVPHERWVLERLGDVPPLSSFGF